jgi:hypothetical protein
MERSKLQTAVERALVVLSSYDSPDEIAETIVEYMYDNDLMSDDRDLLEVELVEAILASTAIEVDDSFHSTAEDLAAEICDILEDLGVFPYQDDEE